MLRNGFLVETRLRWETRPRWPERMQKARRLTDIDTEMTGHAARGRSVVTEAASREHVQQPRGAANAALLTHPWVLCACWSVSTPFPA